MVNNKKGFTLIELMIVVAIIGILAAVAIPAYGNYTRKARVTEVTNAMGAVGNALIEYYQDQGEYPSIGTLPQIESTLGMTIPSTYVSLASVAAGTADATISVTFNSVITPDFDGDTITMVVHQGSKAVWGGTMTQTYIPRNN